MLYTATGYKLGMAAANPIQLSKAVERWEEEHASLRSKIRNLELHTKEIWLLEDPLKAYHALRALQHATADFVMELERHANWEEQELFAFLQAYFGFETGPTILPSFWVLEKDHELADSFIQSFNEAMHALTPDLASKKNVEEAASHLLQACFILNDHITMEEHLVFPLTEQVFTAFEYFFS
ncbi:hemerythrin domain-containing protein [Paenibacillus sp. SI8]|uniref:hemerythrin domain-containing protein n=1 Tax=unclassified Paenibacillus TaxID=185978 RepID=UPI003464F33E